MSDTDYRKRPMFADTNWIVAVLTLGVAIAIFLVAVA